MKQCSQCKKQKPFSDFNKRHNRPIGYQSSCRLCSSSNRVYRTFNLNQEQFENILISQNYSCAICKIYIEDYRLISRYTNFAVDHCHASGRIRGLLCTNCNVGLGLFKDNISSLQRAISYLEINTVKDIV